MVFIVRVLNQSTEDWYILLRRMQVRMGPPQCACANVVWFDLATGDALSGRVSRGEGVPLLMEDAEHGDMRPGREAGYA